MTLVSSVLAMAICVAVALVLPRRFPQFAGAAGPATEPPLVPAAVGLLGAGLIGVVVLGGPMSQPAVALLGFALIALGEEVVTGRAAAVDRMAAAGLVGAACTLPLLRYGASSYADLRGAAQVLGSPLVTAPGGRGLLCLLGAAIGLGAASWLASAAPTGSAEAVAHPLLLVPGAAALLLTASFLGSGLPSGGGALSVARRVALWALWIGALAVLQLALRERVRRIPRPGVGALASVVVLGISAAALAA